MDRPAPRLLLCTATDESSGLDAVAAALAVAATPAEDPAGAALLLDLRAQPRPRRGTLLASAPARALEGELRSGSPSWLAAARGRLCFAAPGQVEAGTDASAAALEVGLARETGTALVVCLCDPAELRRLVDLGRDRAEGGAALVLARQRSERSLLALLTAELRAEGLPFKAWTWPIGTIPARRALAGLEPGGETGRRSRRIAPILTGAGAMPGTSGAGWSRRPAIASERGQALPAVLGVAILVVALALILLAIGSAATAKGRMQRSADLAALSAARSMRDDFDRLFVPSHRRDGTPNPAHLEQPEYLERARAAALEAGQRNGTEPGLVDVGFPDGSSFAPLRVRVRIEGAIEVEGPGSASQTADATTAAAAEAAVDPPASGSTAPEMATGGGYSGPLAYRQGKPMRPDVAAAFDRMAAAAARAGVSLVINSGFRSDAEQRDLWEQNPDPRWVAPPGTSLHRCGTELDLGPSSAYAWLAANAPRFGFNKRYSWEPWHFGFDDGPDPCSAAGDRLGGDGADAARTGGGLPSFVPAQFREAIIESASRNGVSAALLAAQLLAESDFNPNAASPAGAQGIAQFMPATAGAYGLDDPFDPDAAIDAQGRLMSDLLEQFGSIELALAAYNAGPGAVSGCNCVPPYPETQGYVARILGLLDGAGQLTGPAPTLEIRLVD